MSLRWSIGQVMYSRNKHFRKRENTDSEGGIYLAFQETARSLWFLWNKQEESSREMFREIRGGPSPIQLPYIKIRNWAFHLGEMEGPCKLKYSTTCDLTNHLATVFFID